MLAALEGVLGFKMGEDSAKMVKTSKIDSTALFMRFLGFCNLQRAPEALAAEQLPGRWRHRKTIETMEKCCTVVNFRGLRRSRPRKV